MPNDPHPILTLILQIWAGLGPLVGLVAGHLMTRSWQREQWVRDSKKQEYKELITSMSNASVELLMYLASQGTPHAMHWQKWLDAHKEAMVKLADRVFIAHDLSGSNIPQRYMELSGEIREGGEPTGDVVDKMGLLIEEVRQLALRI